ncbi:repetitive organellar protein isoform X4 [Hydra vulgaris]|uniref:Repetitive organellar protein isoform X4 n=1 Tax=Hydra vulgaris TaxID=6087 RepID=A0ABM4BSX9_HYDVU
MFTLGDVADILDSALCTGISIVDALSKLSDAADKSSELNKEKCLESLQIKNKINENLTIIPETNLVDSKLNLTNSLTSPLQDYLDTYSFVPQSPVPLRPSYVKKRNRPATFVLKDSEIKTVNDAQLHRIPIIDALDDLCLVADDVFKDFDRKNKSLDERKNESSYEKSLQLEVLINNKVSEILESFKKLDLTVDQILTRKVVTEHIKQDSSQFLKQSLNIPAKESNADAFEPFNTPLKNRDEVNDIQCNLANKKRGAYILSKDIEDLKETHKKLLDKNFNTVSTSLHNNQKTSDFVPLRSRIVSNIQPNSANIKNRATYIILNENEGFKEIQKESVDNSFNQVSINLNVDQKTSDLVTLRNRKEVKDVQCNATTNNNNNNNRDTYILFKNNKDLKESKEVLTHKQFNSLNSSFKIDQETFDHVTSKNSSVISDTQLNSINIKKRGIYTHTENNKDFKEQGLNLVSSSYDLKSSSVSLINKALDELQYIAVDNQKQDTHKLTKDDENIRELPKEPIFNPVQTSITHPSRYRELANNEKHDTCKHFKARKNVFSDFKSSYLNSKRNINMEWKEKQQNLCFPNQDLHQDHHLNKQNTNCDVYDFNMKNEFLASNLAKDSFKLDVKSDRKVSKNNNGDSDSHKHCVISNYDIDTCNYNDKKSSIKFRDKNIKLDSVAVNVVRPNTYTLSGIYPKSSYLTKALITDQSSVKDLIVDGESFEGMNRSSSDPNLLCDEHMKIHSEMVFRSSSISEGLHHFSQPTISNLSNLNRIMSTSLTKLNSLQLFQSNILMEKELSKQSSPYSSSVLSSHSCSSDEWIGDNEQEISEKSHSSSGGSTFSVSSDVSGRTYSISPDQDKDIHQVYMSENNLQKFAKENSSCLFRPFYTRSFSFPTDISGPVYNLDMPKIDSQTSFDSSATFTVVHPKNSENACKIIKKENSFIFIDSNESQNECEETNDESSVNNCIQSLTESNVQSTLNKNNDQIVKMREEKGRQKCGVNQTNTYLISPMQLEQDINVSYFANNLELKNRDDQLSVLSSQIAHREKEIEKIIKSDGCLPNVSERDKSSKQQDKKKVNNRFSLNNDNQEDKKPKHTQFLRRKTPLVAYPEIKSKNDTEPLSSRLAALRMQLEEKRRQFDEEKKRKLSEWNKEKAKLLQNAFFDVISNGKENQDPNKTIDDCKQPSWDDCFDNVNKKETIPNKNIVPETSVEISNQMEKKNLHQNLNSSLSATNGMWFVGVGNENLPNSPNDIPLMTSNVEVADNLGENVTILESSNDALQLSSLTDVDENKLSTAENKFGGEQKSNDITMRFKSLSLNNKSDDMLNDNYFTPNSSYSKELNKKNHLFNSLEGETIQNKNATSVLFTPSTTTSNYSETSVNPNYAFSESALTQSDFNQGMLNDLHLKGVLDELPLDTKSVLDDLPLHMKNVQNSLVDNDGIFSSFKMSQEHLLHSVDQSFPKNQALNEQSVNNYQNLQTPQNNSQVSENNFITSENQVTPTKQNNILNDDKNNLHEMSPQSFGFTLEENDMTPEQKKKKERFIQNRMKKLQIEKEKKKAALEKKNQEEEKLAAVKLLQEEEDRLAKEKLKEQRLLDEATALQNKMYNKRLNELTYNTNPLVRKDQLPAPVKTSSNKEDNRIQTSVSNNPALRPNNYPNTESLLNTCSSPTCDSISTAQSAFSEYNGPINYQKPSGKSNKKIIQNAIMHCCLCGEVNKEAKAKCLDTLTLSDASHFLVLFREGLKFRSVYAYNPEEQTISRIYGIGPKMITSKMISTYYKYNSGAKEFYSLDTKHLSIQVDGVMIKKELWDKKTSVTKTEPIQKTKPVQYKSLQIQR